VFIGAKIRCQTLQQTNCNSKNGILIHDNGKPLFIKQPNIMELAMLYQAIMTNIKMIRTVFRNSYKKSTQTDR